MIGQYWFSEHADLRFLRNLVKILYFNYKQSGIDTIIFVAHSCDNFIQKHEPSCMIYRPLDFVSIGLRSPLNSGSCYYRRQITMISIAISGKHGLALPQAKGYINIIRDQCYTTSTLSFRDLWFHILMLL